jgi:hypothetical protein
MSKDREGNFPKKKNEIAGRVCPLPAQRLPKAHEENRRPQVFSMILPVWKMVLILSPGWVCHVVPISLF